MDLNQLANLGEFIGGVAVLVTLAYLAVQVRQVKLSNESAAGDETARSWRENLRFLIDNMDLFQAGAYGLGRVQGSEAMKFVAMMQFLFAYIENFHAKYQAGMVDPEEWDRLYRVIV